MKHNNQRLAALSRRLDPIWWLIARVLSPKRPLAVCRVPKSILLVELNLLGDMVMLIPLLRVIRRCHPGAHIGLMAGPWGREILGVTGLIDEFIPLRAPWVTRRQGLRGLNGLVTAIRVSRSRDWDWGIDVRGDVRNALLLVLARAGRRVGFCFTGGAALLTDVVADDGVLRHIVEHHDSLARSLSMFMTADERIPTLQGAGAGGPAVSRDRRRIAFHFGASMALRKMPVGEASALVAALHHERGVRTILVDTPDTLALNTGVIAELPPAVAATVERWQGSLREFISFLETLDKFYAMDSGPAHLAAALGIDTTVFFGPHLSLAVRPMGRTVTVIERSDVPCRPCDQHTCSNPVYQECLGQIVPLVIHSTASAASFPESTNVAAIN